MSKNNRSKFVRIALVLPTEYDYARDVLQGIISATRDRNMYASALPAGNGLRRLPWLFRIHRGIHGHSSRYLAKWFKDWNPDGFICQIYDDRLAKLYRDTGKPVVELFASRPHTEFPRILPDDLATGRLAATHFLERGFNHFAFFGAGWMLWSRERETGFREEIEQAFRARAQAEGNAGPPRNFTFSSYAWAGGVPVAAPTGSQKKWSSVMGAWLASLPKPLAVFAANDLWGFELVQAARERGLHVPEDVAVLGVDNEELLCELAHPPLSSIRIGGEQIGLAAVAMLERLLRGKSAAVEMARIPPVEVMTRQSTDVLAVEDRDVAAALRHIRLHAAEGLSVKEMIGAVSVNRRTLERRFVQVLGYSPLEEIHRVRLERAKKLLRGDLAISEIAQRSGFSTPEYLATSFLRSTGMSPSAYRKRFGVRHTVPHF